MDVILHHRTLTLTLMLTLTLTYFIIPYSIILHSIIPYSMIQHSSTIVVGGMMQIALRPLFHHENAAPIFYCTNIIII